MTKQNLNQAVKPPVTPPSTPKDAAVMILLRDPDDPKIFWVRRAPKLAFMAGYYAFPGGQRDAGDAEIAVLNCADPLAACMRVCAAREFFEEAGVLLARGAERLSAEQRAQLRQALSSEQITFKQLLEGEGLTIAAEDFIEAPRWVTPAHSARRYDTRFFAAWLPEEQETEILPGELDAGEWLRPREALQRWIDGDALIATPILCVMQALNEGVNDFAARLHLVPQEVRDLHERIELTHGFFIAPLRTPTIPPATHTNCYLIGGDEMVIVDPGSPYEDEQAVLDHLVESFVAEGRRFREIIITHLHPDHIGGVQHLAERFNLPVAAHRLTAEAIAGEVKVNRFIEDNEVIELKSNNNDLTWRLRALWTPGHARGHLSFYEERTGALLTGDCVVGFGTVVIAPPEGNMLAYLASLRRLLALPRLTALLPGHGPVLANPQAKLEEYLVHRLARERKIVQALADGARTLPQIVKAVYTDVPETMHQLAELSVRAHLEKLASENVVTQQDNEYALL